MNLKPDIHLKDCNDKLRWNLKKNEMFSISSFYSYLTKNDITITPLFPYKIIQKSQAPSRISFFAWEAIKNRILTNDNLMKRGNSLVNRCFLCKCTTESSNHILLRCPYTYHLWSLVYSLSGVHWVMADSVINDLLAWESFTSNNQTSCLIPLIIFQVIWKEMNNKTFEY